jgi:ATP-binding cassette subfamily C (CFTR/MRP) protein 1
MVQQKSCYVFFGPVFTLSFPNLGTAVSLKNAKLAWSANGLNESYALNLQLEKGKLVAVVGSVGSGKTTLLSSIAGEMHLLQGKVEFMVMINGKNLKLPFKTVLILFENFFQGTVAIVPQRAWIINDTVKENILFGRPYEENLYERVVFACSLNDDISSFSAGNNTELGEKVGQQFFT